MSCETKSTTGSLLVRGLSFKRVTAERLKSCLIKHPAGRHGCPLRLHETGHPLWGYLCSPITYINSFSSASGTDCSPAGLGSNPTRTYTLCLSTLCVAAYLEDFLNQAICQEAHECRGTPLLILCCT